MYSEVDLQPNFRHITAMKLLAELLSALVAFLAAFAMSQLGIDMSRSAQPTEIKRLPVCSTVTLEEEKPSHSADC